MLTREWACVGLALVAGAAGLRGLPFPDNNAILELVRIERPAVFYAVKGCYTAMLFTTPYIVCSVIASLGYIFGARAGDPGVVSTLPLYPGPSKRTRLSVVIGEVHHAKKPGPAPQAHWLAIPERGLYTGIAVFGAIGSGKTSACMYPFAEQLLSYRADDAERRIGGLVLEVKGDFCHKVKSLLAKYGAQTTTSRSA